MTAGGDGEAGAGEAGERVRGGKGIVAERLEALAIARLATAAKPPRPAQLADALRRFAPRDRTDAQWRQEVDAALEGLRAGEIVDEGLRVRSGELARRFGGGVKKWQQLADRVLPALGLGVGPGEAKVLAKLAGRDGWAAAIAARALGIWQGGAPPSPSALCDALVWRELGLAGTPKRCPPEVRAHFVRGHAGGDAGAPERHVRLLAARTVDAQRAELRALCEGLVRVWLAGREIGATSGEEAGREARQGEATSAGGAARRGETASGGGAARWAEARPAEARSLVEDVRAAAREAREGVFGERKVFISAIWEMLRARPAWAGLGLDELKVRLVEAHRNRELVLARADFVAAMDPALVAASETRTDGATFHFVVREPVA